ncbi:hypothetical protein Q9L58_006888 [Maublancomyces gigas]|uniref:Uncharacterized protein n=1 Tax=Discina gigas TaxID=1032678 RepID=A0ABR3GEQ8_9PEZI
MVVLFTLGVGSAISHHYYYCTLHGTAAGGADRQQWVNQIGTGLAFLCNAALASVIAISRTQWVWTTLRKRFISVAGIDALFGVTLDPMYFTNLDMVRRAKLATFMAITIWVFPFTAILTPGTISVQTESQIHSVDCYVRTLTFEFDPDSKATKLCCENDNLTSNNVANYHDTTVGIPVYVERVLTLAALTGHIQIPTNVGQYSGSGSAQLHETTLAQDCGKNCSCTVTFLGPGVQCVENTDWRLTDLVVVSAEDYMEGVYYRAEIGTEGVLWVGYVPIKGTPKPHVLFCRRSVARYRIRLEVLNYEFREPIIEAFETLYTIPVISPQYPDTIYLPNQAVFHTIWSAINGNLSTSSPFRGSDITLTQLFADMIDHPSQLGPNIEMMARTIVVSLLSIDSPGTNKSHPLLNYASLEGNSCNTTRTSTVHDYKARRLIIVYATSASLSMLMAVVGFVALGRNGVSSSVTVSAIIRTTRNPTLDRLFGGSCLGADPIPKELGEMRLKFGEVRAEGEMPKEVEVGVVGHVALGIEGEVFPIRNGARYS